MTVRASLCGFLVFRFPGLRTGIDDEDQALVPLAADKGEGRLHRPPSSATHYFSMVAQVGPKVGYEWEVRGRWYMNVEMLHWRYLVACGRFRGSWLERYALVLPVTNTFDRRVGGHLADES